MSTPNRQIPYVPENTLNPAAGLNEALNVIDAIFVPFVIDMDLTAPPGSPVDGDLHIVASPATGLWENQENNLARYVDEGDFWQFFVAGEQVSLIINRDDGNLYKFDDGSDAAWVLAAGLGDAPNDGEYYARRNEAWESFSAGGAAFPPVVTESGANLDADETNAGNYTRFTNASATYTFDDAESFEVGAEYHGRYAGSGDLTITEAGGMTINPPAGGTLVIPPDGTFTVKIIASDEADLFGLTIPSS